MDQTEKQAYTHLVEENKRLKERVKCLKCKVNDRQTLLLPCRHLLYCEACVEAMNDCDKCNKKILGTVRCFLV